MASVEWYGSRLNGLTRPRAAPKRAKRMTERNFIRVTGVRFFVPLIDKRKI